MSVGGERQNVDPLNTIPNRSIRDSSIINSLNTPKRKRFFVPGNRSFVQQIMLHPSSIIMYAGSCPQSKDTSKYPLKQSNINNQKRL